MKYKGNVEITKENQKEWAEKLKDITEIGGYVTISDEGKAEFPALKAIGGYVYIYGEGKAEFPKLTEIGGDVRVYGSAEFPENYKQNTQKGEFIRQKLSERLRKKFFIKGLIFADGILTRLISKRKLGKITFYKTRKLGSKKIIYIARKGSLFSHGETQKQAFKDLRYKISDRNTEKYTNWTIEIIKPIDEIISSYRTITGACFEGTKMFCEGKKLPKKMSIKKAIELTLGQYGNKQYAKFFEVK